MEEKIYIIHFPIDAGGSDELLVKATDQEKAIIIAQVYIARVYGKDEEKYKEAEEALAFGIHSGIREWTDAVYQNGGCEEG